MSRCAPSHGISLREVFPHAQILALPMCSVGLAMPMQRRCSLVEFCSQEPGTRSIWLARYWKRYREELRRS